LPVLRNHADLRSVAYLVIATGLVVWQWSLPAFSPLLFAWAMFMAVTG
jgi:hypothetical protein